ncbi:MAG TPA: hypothetical protein VHL80_22050, partial [Polyangia bacterium]|nr:hypothetical protein [Polyangia bacterium]
MRATSYLRFFLCTGLIAFACGRTDLDLGSSTPVTTGAGGDVGSGAAGATGTATGVGTGTSTGVGTGTAGSFVTGAAGEFVTGAGGAIVGAAGTGVTQGLAGFTGAAGTGSVGTGAAGSFVTGAAGAIVGAAGTSGTTTGSAGVAGTSLIPCGQMSCLAGKQECCIQLLGGAPTPSCIPAGQTCGAGVSLTCTSSGQCGDGQSCCASAAMLSTTCEPAMLCLATTGIALCQTDAECPPSAQSCCPLGGIGVCRARACGRGGGGGPAGGGPPGGGPAGGGRPGRGGG